jgi:hypothetical protein
MKFKATLIVIALVSLLAVGCTSTPADDTTTEAVTTEVASTEVTSTEADVITTASIVDSAAAFENAVSSEGTWLIAIINDLAVESPLVLDGDFENGKLDADGKAILQRKIALYSQDADRNITARYTLTAPSLTINSVNASIQHGTFVGDLFVSGLNFQLVDAQIEGNIYFTSEEAKSTFTLDEDSSVTGVQEIKK